MKTTITHAGNTYTAEVEQNKLTITRDGVVAAARQPLSTCKCGHPKDRHSRGRGVCFDCFGASDHGSRPYCNRLRRPDPIEAVAEKLRPHGRVVVRRYQTTVEIALDRMDGERWVDTIGVTVLTSAGRLINVIGGELARILGVPVGPQGATDDAREEAAHLDPGCWCGHSREMHQDGTGVCACCVKTLSGYGLADKRFEVRHDGCARFRPRD